MIKTKGQQKFETEEVFICSDQCLKELFQDKNKANEIPNFSKETRCLICGKYLQCKKYIIS